MVVEQTSGDPGSLFNLVEDGVYDASFSYHGYLPGRFKLPQIVEQPGLGVGAESASVALWRVYNKYFSDSYEFDGLELIGMFTHGPGVLHSREPINSLSDLKGKKIRIGGGVQTEIGNRLEVTPVAAPAPKVYEMLQQGIIDGTFLPISEQKNLRLNEVAPNVTIFPGGLYLGSFSIFMNPDFLESLSAEDREAILGVSGEKLSAMAGKAWERIDAVGYKAAEEKDVHVNNIDGNSPVANSFYKAINGMKEDWVTSVSDRTDMAETAMDELWEIARDYENAKQ
ncbi:TRAP-type C4-dicarboxylate transport system, substrate-binding protein [Marinobacterium lutimaris]|uniref:TRAP-type C4-dicarboxylate transport system, substrate-binding protein n=1 Tax=Marinobacterium lutimaris TaxID=568106 RepID=A0A1H5WKF8_9GAMM|nr:TRAP-type C4-dicarboxylate transport system, substrate-binding protein [Marinobacterium lutimaris]